MVASVDPGMGCVSDCLPQVCPRGRSAIKDRRPGAAVNPPSQRMADLNRNVRNPRLVRFE